MSDLSATRDDPIEGTDNAPLTSTLCAPWLADPFAFISVHKRLAWLLRISAMINVALCALCIVLATAISALTPLKEVRVALLRLDDAGEQIAAVEPLGRSVESYDLVMELSAKHFLRQLLAIDGTSQTERLQNAWLFVGDELYKKFTEERISSGAIQDAIDSGLNRSIIVESADVISERDNIRNYAVDFIQVDKRDGKEIERKKLRAYMSMTARPYQLNAEDLDERLKVNPRYIEQNPHGFVVLDMTLKEKEQ